MKGLDRNQRFVFFAATCWFALVLTLGAWWADVILKQNAKIIQLEALLGLEQSLHSSKAAQTQRMVFWESLSFFILLVSSAGALLWFHWRDLRRSRSLQAFLAAWTHELRTPLTSIRLQAESLSELLVSSEQVQPLVSRLLEDAHRLEGQVERTLELARIEKGGVLHLRSLSFKSWFDCARVTWQERYGDKISLSAQVEEIFLQADPQALDVIFRNLFENAVRHSKKNPIRVSLSARKKGHQSVQIIFSDEGRGFLGNFSRLGNLFEKGPDSQGAGVGLYLIRILVEKMGGQCSFTNRNGFEVSLIFPEEASDG